MSYLNPAIFHLFYKKHFIIYSGSTKKFCHAFLIFSCIPKKLIWTYSVPKMDVTDFVNCGMVKNTKNLISRVWSITSSRNENILNLYLRWHILRSIFFVMEITLNHRQILRMKKYFSVKSLFSVLTQTRNNLKPTETIWNHPKTNWNHLNPAIFHLFYKKHFIIYSGSTKKFCHMYLLFSRIPKKLIWT